MLRMVQKPEVDRHHVVNVNKIPHLGAGAVPAIFAKQFDFALRLKLVKLVKSDAGHAALVLFLRAVHIEVAKTHDLAALARRVGLA